MKKICLICCIFAAIALISCDKKKNKDSDINPEDTEIEVARKILTGKEKWYSRLFPSTELPNIINIYKFNNNDIGHLSIYECLEDGNTKPKCSGKFTYSLKRKDDKLYLDVTVEKGTCNEIYLLFIIDQISEDNIVLKGIRENGSLAIDVTLYSKEINCKTILK